jgi:hypothetical protein
MRSWEGSQAGKAIPFSLPSEKHPCPHPKTVFFIRKKNKKFFQQGQMDIFFAHHIGKKISGCILSTNTVRNQLKEYKVGSRY